MSTNPNDPAFAFEGCTIAVQKDLMAIPEMRDKAFAIAQRYQGLTKREEFAKAALQGILADSANWEFFLKLKFPAPEVREQTVLTAIQFADSLIAELNKTSKEA